MNRARRRNLGHMLQQSKAQCLKHRRITAIHNKAAPARTLASSGSLGRRNEPARTRRARCGSITFRKQTRFTFSAIGLPFGFLCFANQAVLTSGLFGGWLHGTGNTLGAFDGAVLVSE